MNSINESDAAQLTRRRERQVEEKYHDRDQRNERRRRVQETKSFNTAIKTSARTDTTAGDYNMDRKKKPIGNVRQPVFLEDPKRKIGSPDSYYEPSQRLNNILRRLMSRRNQTATSDGDIIRSREQETAEAISEQPKDGSLSALSEIYVSIY